MRGKVKKHLFGFIGIFLLIYCCFLQCAAAKAEDEWKTRKYYRDDQLISTESRTFNDQGFIVETSIHYTEGVPMGSHIEYLLDESGKRICGTVFYEDGRNGEYISGFAYDADGNMTEIVWESEYGNMAEKYEYDEWGNETAFVLMDSDGAVISNRVTENFYDEKQRLIKSCSTDIELGEESNAEEKNVIRNYYYDSMHRLIKVTMEDQNNTNLGHYEYFYE